jgi:hypothetical protein
VASEPKHNDLSASWGRDLNSVGILIRCWMEVSGQIHAPVDFTSRRKKKRCSLPSEHSDVGKQFRPVCTTRCKGTVTSVKQTYIVMM